MSEEKETKQTEQEKMLEHVLGGAEKEYVNVSIERKGDKIVIPEGMSLAIAMEWVERLMKAEEKIIKVSTRMKAYPFDAAYALYRAIQSIFGFADISGGDGPSGEKPPNMINIQLPDGEYVRVPWGQMKFPGLDDDCYVETKYDDEKMEFILAGNIRRKYEPVFTRVVTETKRILREHSIYRGKAIKVDLSFIGNDQPPIDPVFMDLTGMNDDSILLTDVVRKDYSAVMLRIEKQDLCLARNIPLKHGCLLTGKYGTGKTLLGRWTAKKAIEFGWTFIYLEDCRDLSHALKLAAMYSPAIVFAEDVDKATEGERSVEMNDILNTIDGIDNKSEPIITILTSNKPEKINKAFLRAGRIDSYIEMGELDEKNSMLFIQKFVVDGKGKKIISKEADYTDAAKALCGVVPAFISEIINKAKMYAMYRDGDGETVMPEDIIIAAESFKMHIERTKENIDLSEAEKAGIAVAKALDQIGTLIDTLDKTE